MHVEVKSTIIENTGIGTRKNKMERKKKRKLRSGLELGHFAPPVHTELTTRPFGAQPSSRFRYS